MTYPHQAGWTEPTTSRDAAKAVERSGRKKLLQNKLTQLFKTGFTGTSEQAAYALREDYVSVQPRISELKSLGIIEPTGRTSKGRYGRPIKVWRLA